MVATAKQRHHGPLLLYKAIVLYWDLYLPYNLVHKSPPIIRLFVMDWGICCMDFLNHFNQDFDGLTPYFVCVCNRDIIKLS